MVLKSLPQAWKQNILIKIDVFPLNTCLKVWENSLCVIHVNVLSFPWFTVSRRGGTGSHKRRISRSAAFICMFFLKYPPKELFFLRRTGVECLHLLAPKKQPTTTMITTTPLPLRPPPPTPSKSGVASPLTFAIPGPNLTGTSNSLWHQGGPGR